MQNLQTPSICGQVNTMLLMLVELHPDKASIFLTWMKFRADALILPSVHCLVSALLEHCSAADSLIHLSLSGNSVETTHPLVCIVVCTHLSCHDLSDYIDCSLVPAPCFYMRKQIKKRKK